MSSGFIVGLIFGITAGLLYFICCIYSIKKAIRDRREIIERNFKRRNEKYLQEMGFDVRDIDQVFHGGAVPYHQTTVKFATHDADLALNSSHQLDDQKKERGNSKSKIRRINLEDIDEILNETLTTASYEGSSVGCVSASETITEKLTTHVDISSKEESVDALVDEMMVRGEICGSKDDGKFGNDGKMVDGGEICGSQEERKFGNEGKSCMRNEMTNSSKEVGMVNQAEICDENETEEDDLGDQREKLLDQSSREIEIKHVVMTVDGDKNKIDGGHSSANHTMRNQNQSNVSTNKSSSESEKKHVVMNLDEDGEHSSANHTVRNQNQSNVSTNQNSRKPQATPEGPHVHYLPKQPVALDFPSDPAPKIKFLKARNPGLRNQPQAPGNWITARLEMAASEYASAQKQLEFGFKRAPLAKQNSGFSSMDEESSSSLM